MTYFTQIVTGAIAVAVALTGSPQIAEDASDEAVAYGVTDSTLETGFNVQVDVEDGRPVLLPLQQFMVDEVERLYAEIGIELPPVDEIKFGGCGIDRDGIYRWSRDADGELTDQICLMRYDIGVLVHEFAHAIDYHYGTESGRSEYLVSFGDRYESWLDKETEYLNRAGESFARQTEMYLIEGKRTESFAPEAVEAFMASLSLEA